MNAVSSSTLCALTVCPSRLTKRELIVWSVPSSERLNLELGGSSSSSSSSMGLAHFDVHS